MSTSNEIINLRSRDDSPVLPIKQEYRLECLSRREREVARIYANGAGYRDISEQLCIAPTTVRTHLQTIYRKLKITSKLELYQAVLADQGQSAPSKVESHPSCATGRASIAVLPFSITDKDSEQHHLGDGIADELITTLSQIEELFVVAKNSSFQFREKALDTSQIARQLGVRYLLDGSVRRSGDRLRISAQLLVAPTGQQIWAQRYDGEMSDIFSLQDHIANSVVTAVRPTLRTAEIDRSIRKDACELDAYDCFLRALPYLARHTPTSMQTADELLEKAIGLDPNYPPALAYAGLLKVNRPQFGLSKSPQSDFQIGLKLAQRALDAAPDSAIALAIAGYTTMQVRRDHLDAIDLANAAISRSSSSFLSFQILGWIYNWFGDGQLAIEQFQHCSLLSPLDRRSHLTDVGLAFANLMEGRPETSLKFAKKAYSKNSEFPPCLRQMVAALATLERLEEASEVALQLLKLQPGFTVSSWCRSAPFRETKAQKQMIAALIAGGLPE